ncbi:hypothetical protein [Microcoleus sp. PH2017_16_JOR_D_A]|uniref:hypothetical protein n=1 Tax=Microcoleus sp. PH2017_16_JOR_D_A TaxID=2798827 RepID=UPI0025F2271C|nr:hypothetical protein [Microcoleus sp. PH2017_16_JOR_D_A]
MSVNQFNQKELVESPPDREKLKSDYSLLQSSDLRVEAALKLSTVNCQLSIRLFITPILGLKGRGRSQTVNCQLSTVNCSTTYLNQA